MEIWRTVRRGLPVVLVAMLVAGAGQLRGQSLADLRRALQEGGGWVSFEVVDGKAAFESLTLPTGGMRLQGYFQIWDGNRGTWTVRASDLAAAPDGETLLDVTVKPGESVPFVRQTGLFSRLRIDVRWSDPGDTTLYVWVGLGPDAPPPPGRGG